MHQLDKLCLSKMADDDNQNTLAIGTVTTSVPAKTTLSEVLRRFMTPPLAKMTCFASFTTGGEHWHEVGLLLKTVPHHIYDEVSSVLNMPPFPFRQKTKADILRYLIEERNSRLALLTANGVDLEDHDIVRVFMDKHPRVLKQVTIQPTAAAIAPTEDIKLSTPLSVAIRRSIKRLLLNSLVPTEAFLELRRNKDGVLMTQMDAGEYDDSAVCRQVFEEPAVAKEPTALLTLRNTILGIRSREAKKRG